MRKSIVFAAAALVALVAPRAQAQLFQGPYGDGGTWNVYEVVDITATWIDALSDAQGNSQFGVSGNLPDIMSGAENKAIQFIAGGGDVWIGLTDREGVAPPATNGGLPAPQESDTLPNSRTQGWAWTTGKPFSFQNWGGGEPNDSGGEDAVHIRGDGLWNDHKSGMGPDEPIVPVLQPGTSTDESGGPAFKYVIEYLTESANPLAGPEVISLPALMPDAIATFPAGGAGFMAVTDLQPGETVTAPAISVSAQIAAIASGELAADIFTKQVPIADMTDPGTNANGGPVLGGDPIPLPITDELGPAQDDFIEVMRGFINVTEPGPYTFNFHTDDGFVAQIKGHPFTAGTGNGTVDPDEGVAVHSNNTGDSNTQAVVDLPAGVHEFNMYWWERGGGAFGEVSTAKGDFVNGPGGIRPQWLALGDGSEVAERVEQPGAGAGRLTEPFTIININNVDGADQPLEFAREILFENIDNPDAVSDDNEVFVVDDHNVNPGGCPFGVFPHDGNVEQFPNTAGNIDNFVSGIFGKFQVDDGDETPGETQTFSFHVDSDDRSYFRIVGQDFEEVDNQEIFEVDGDDAMWADVNTCNTNYTGIITLTEGVTYEFEALHVEAGGDAGMQVLVAAGDFLFDPDPTAFSPLALPGGEGTTFARNIGLPFVDEQAAIPGDYNGNGALDAGDLDMQAAAIKSGDLAFDLTGDGAVNFDDRLNWVKTLKKTWIGDANLDGVFNTTDLIDVFQGGKFEQDQMASWTEGDFDGDMRFGTADLLVAFQDGGFEKGPIAATSAVPEPSSIILTLMGVMGLLGMARRRNG